MCVNASSCVLYALQFLKIVEIARMLRVSSPTHAFVGALQAPPPAVVARILGDLSLEDQRFASEHDLGFYEMLSLLNAPSLSETLDEKRLVVLTQQLDLALHEREWRMAEMVMCMFLRTDLREFYDVACSSNLGYIAQRAAQKRGARAAATSRFGRLLVNKLVNLCAERDLRV